jgi:spermidine synthase
MNNPEEIVEELISELEIKRILVAERNPDYFSAAEEYFSTLHERGILIRFALTEKEAKEKIKESFNQKNLYDIVISDYYLDGTKSGIEIMKEASRHGSFGVLTLNK